MLLTTLLKKHYDIETHTISDDSFVGTNTGKEIHQIWIYEKGQDCEPLLILKDAKDLLGLEGWVVGNVYSTLATDARYTEAELKALIKAGAIKSQYA